MESHTQDLPQLSRTELLELKQQLDSEIASIKMQIDQARLTQQQTGKYADRTWYVKANHAIKIKGLESQAIQLELSRRKEEKRVETEPKKHKRPDTLEGRFIEIARKRLSDDVFTDILDEAQALATTETEHS